MLEIGGWNKGTYFIETDIRDILNDFRWSLTSVYGPAKHMSGQGTLSKNQRVTGMLSNVKVTYNDWRRFQFNQRRERQKQQSGGS